MANITSAIDDNTEDDATGEARARLRAESEARRLVQAEALLSANERYYALITQAQSHLDTRIWDDGEDDGEGSAGAMRSIVAAQSRERVHQEKLRLEQENAVLSERLAHVTAQTDDGDGMHTSII